MAIVRLSHLADGDLDSIRDFICKNDRAAANSVLEELFNTLELLAANSGIGQRRDDLQPGLRLFSLRPYVIMYLAAEDGIHVVRIVLGARDFPALFSHDS
jgi:toxin ParE1/3/4